MVSTRACNVFSSLYYSEEYGFCKHVIVDIAVLYLVRNRVLYASFLVAAFLNAICWVFHVCFVIAPKSCKNGEFTCNNHRCIRRGWVCDGENDCQDNSDEEKSICTKTVKPNCKAYEFPCRSSNTGPIGRCILKEWKCDGKRDCSDGSDEEDCNKIELCRPNEFKCRNGSCIAISKKCDMNVDCPDGDDEVECGKSIFY